MHAYEAQFKKIREILGMNIKNEENNNCKCKKRVNLLLNHYTCIECGIVTGQGTVEYYYPKYSDLSRKPFRQVPYNRLNRLKIVYLDNLHCSRHLKTEIKHMFVQVETFIMHNNLSFPRYNYVLYQIICLLRRKKFYHYFKCRLPKTTAALYNFDQTWKQVCEHFGWPFQSTVCILCHINKKYGLYTV